jgi:SWI/SNF-related matrix-associated actin-dependent regulator of chromatin subfamily A member 5
MNEEIPDNIKVEQGDMNVESNSETIAEINSSSTTTTESTTNSLDKFDSLIERATTLVSGKSKIVEPAKKAANKKGRRLTEKEEDEMLLMSANADLDDTQVESTRLVKQPTTVTGTMRDYQLEGLNWMIKLSSDGFSGILADEMGLGKTLQCISILAYLKEYKANSGPHIVVVPLTTLGNWEREFANWCPTLNVCRLHGNAEERRATIEERIKPRNFEVLITSYEMAILEKGALSRVDWKFMIVDEAHRLKNENSKLSQICRAFKSTNRLLVTGTPLQNNLHELWALLNFLLPDIFSDSVEFDTMFKVDGTIASDEDSQKQQSLALKKLHAVLRPFMLRRLKVDVAKNLPPKKEVLVYVGMAPLQRKVYKDVLLGNIDAINGTVKQKSKLLNLVMQLRKASNHPYLFENVEDRTLDAYGEHLVENCGKMIVLDKLLKKLKAQGSRVLIFSQMTRSLDILQDYMDMRGYNFCRIDGSTSTEERDQNMLIFNAPDSEKFAFLLSTRSGGLGINLATADIVIIYDSDWNPQMDLQAQDRGKCNFIFHMIFT